MSKYKWYIFKEKDMQYVKSKSFGKSTHSNQGLLCSLIYSTASLDSMDNKDPGQTTHIPMLIYIMTIWGYDIGPDMSF